MQTRNTAIGDFLRLGANAFAGGLAAAIALALITLALAGAAQAATPGSGPRGNQPWSVALTPAAQGDAAGVGALWARSKIASLMDEQTRGAAIRRR
jgi:hypothetical protein